jgi:fumarate hydratase class I
VEEVPGVYLMEFGIPEAMWHFRVKDFAAIVTMDAHGNSLHADIERQTGEVLETAYSNPRMILNGEISPLAGLLS